MDQQTREKIEKFKGLDFCCGKKQRMWCPKHMWDVPAIYRKAWRKYVREFHQHPKVLTKNYLNAILL